MFSWLLFPEVADLSVDILIPWVALFFRILNVRKRRTIYSVNISETQDIHISFL